MIDKSKNPAIQVEMEVSALKPGASLKPEAVYEKKKYRNLEYFSRFFRYSIIYNNEILNLA